MAGQAMHTARNLDDFDGNKHQFPSIASFQ
jgi:hypothetical protein